MNKVMSINICSGSHKWPEVARAKAHGCDFETEAGEMFWGQDTPASWAMLVSWDHICEECAATAGTGSAGTGAGSGYSCIY